MKTNTDKSFDLHIWPKPETKNLVALFTVSEGRHPFCVDLPLEQALECIEKRMRKAVGAKNENQPPAPIGRQ